MSDVLCACAVVTSIHPSYGPVEGYTLITVTGTNFHAGLESAYRCRFDSDLDEYPITVINSTTMMCRAAKHEPGIANFMVAAMETNTYVEVSPDVVFQYHATLFVADYNQHQVLRFNADTGEFLNVFVQPHSGGLRGPSGMAFGLDFNFYVASEQTSR